MTIIQQITQALGEAHNKDIVHRDIKPGNIFLCKPSTPGAQKNVMAKLLDFGIAKSVGFDGQTVTGQMMGTPTYMSPEQIVNIKEVDQRTDIYSLGIVFYHMICGSPPFKGDSYFDTMRMHMQAPLPALNLKTRHKNVYQALTNLLTKMTAKDKRDRHRNALELIEEINKIQTLVLRITTKSAARKSERQQKSTQKKANSTSKASSLKSPKSLPSSKEAASSQASTPASNLMSSNSTPNQFNGFAQTSPAYGASQQVSVASNTADSSPVAQSVQNTITQVNYGSVSQDHDDELIKEPEESLRPSYGWRESLKEDSISENPLEFLREVEANNIDLPPPLDPFAVKASSSKSRSSSNQVISSASASIKLKVPAQTSHKVTMTEKEEADSGELKTSAIVSSASFQMNMSAKPQSTSDAHSELSDTDPQNFSYNAGRDDHLSVLAPSPPKVLRVLILDPNQYASQLYQKGLMAGAAKRTKTREAKGITSSDMLTVTLSTTEADLKEDLEWGADLVLMDLKAKDGSNEAEGISLIKSLKKQIPSHCYLIALCKEQVYADDALMAGADRVLMKPVRNRQLFDTLAHYLWPTSL